jgi:DNA polymerase III delta subunit
MMFYSVTTRLQTYLFSSVIFLLVSNVDRSMDFTIALLQRLEEDPDQQSLVQLVEAAYEVSLKPWHGWISSAACKIALKLIPERKIFTGLLLGMGQDCSALKDEIEKLALLLRPLLDDIHSMMATFRLDRLKST